MTALRCPACGAAMLTPAGLRALGLSPLQARLLRAVRRGPGHSAAELAAVVYEDRPPDAAEVVVRTLVRRINGRLRPLGARIRGGRGAGYHVRACPAAGASPCACRLPAAPVDHLAQSLSPTQARLLRIIAEAPGLTRPELADRLYADDPEGGPDGAWEAISDFVQGINRRIAASGWRVRSSRQARESGYALTATS